MGLAVYLDGSRDGHWMGHFLEETGCIWIAPTRELAAAAAAAEISRFQTWLRLHGEAHDRPREAAGSVPDQAVEIVEAQEVENFGQSGAAVGFFGPDLAPATNDDILTAVRRLGYARRDLLETVAGLPAAALDWKPPGGKRTVRENLYHVRNCHGWYLTRILGRTAVETLLPEPWPEDPFDSLEWVIRRATEALLALPEGLRQGALRADRPPESWTARKMLRRFVEHEREHVEVVRRTLGWLREGAEGHRNPTGPSTVCRGEG